MVNPEMATRLAEYQLRLPIFEGPLDVLLRMIERSELEITDVSLVAVTDQFLAYVETLRGVPPEVVAEFAATAARLLVLKSRSLLPAPPSVEEEPEPDDLTQQLRAYQAVKAAAGFLQERERAGLRSFVRDTALPEDLPVAERLVPVDVAGLMRALRRSLQPRRPAPVRYRPTPVITLAEMVGRLLSRVVHGRRVRFSSIVGATAPRSERAVAFIALLSLLRQQVVEATQSSLFGEIEIERCDPVPAVADD